MQTSQCKKYNESKHIWKLCLLDIFHVLKSSALNLDREALKARGNTCRAKIWEADHTFCWYPVVSLVFKAEVWSPVSEKVPADTHHQNAVYRIQVAKTVNLSVAKSEFPEWNVNMVEKTSNLFFENREAHNTLTSIWKKKNKNQKLCIYSLQLLNKTSQSQEAYTFKISLIWHLW